MQRQVDSLGVVKNWYAFFDNALCLASSASTEELSRLIRVAFPDLVFMLTEISFTTTSGWLPKSIWAFVADPQPAGSEAA